MTDAPKKRGRPPKPKEDKPKRPRGRPPKPKEDKPKRPRGRPRLTDEQKKINAEARKLKKEEAFSDTRGLKHNTKGNFLASGVIQSNTEMDESNLTVAPYSKIYAKDTDTGEKIGSIVHSITNDLANVGKRINFQDTEMVRDTAFRYLQSCERTGVLPSKVGLARACGVTHQGMDKFIVNHAGHPSAELLLMLYDAFVECLSQASLSGSVQPIVSIFLQKALYGIRDTDPVVKPIDKPLGEAQDTKDVMKKYLPSYEEEEK